MSILTTTTTTITVTVPPACPVCGTPLRVRPGRQGRPPSWCSKQCRQAAWRLRAAADRAASAAAQTIEQLAEARTELNEAQAVMAMAYGRMLDSVAETGDDAGAALGHPDMHRWETPLAEAARTLQRAGARVAELAAAHARCARDYRTATRRAPATRPGEDETLAALARHDGQGAEMDRDELFDAIEDVLILGDRGELPADLATALDGPISTLGSVFDNTAGDGPLGELTAAAAAVVDAAGVFRTGDLPPVVVDTLGRLDAALPARR